MDIIFVQDGQTVAQPDIVRDIARLGFESLPAFFRRPRIPETAVGEAERVVLVLHDLVDGGEHFRALEFDQGRIAVRVERPGIGYGLLMIGAVGGVAINKQERVPPVEDVFEEALELRALELHRIPVKVKVLAVRPHPDSLLGTGLLAAVGRVDLFISVSVEDRADQDDQLIQIGRLDLLKNVARHHQRGFLAFDFAGMDIGLDIDDRLLAISGLERRSRHRAADNEERHIPSFRAPTKRFDPDQGTLLLELPDEIQDVGMPGCCGIVRRFSHGLRLLLGK